MKMSIDRAAVADPIGPVDRNELAEADTVGPWVEECLDITGKMGDRIPSALLAESYREYCIDQSIGREHRKSEYKMAGILVSRFPMLKKRKYRIDAIGGKRKEIRGVAGCRFK